MVRTYAVPGISCEHCRTALEGGIGELLGVEGVTVDLEARTVEVRGEPDEQAVLAAIEEAGYDEVSRIDVAAPSPEEAPPPA